jgi:sodium/potassium-transporting ATPase subunit beta
MLYIFLLTLNPNHPKWIGEDGLIGKNPGIGFRPMPDQEKNVESTLIWFDRNKEKKDPFWSKELDDFFDKSEC